MLQRLISQLADRAFRCQGVRCPLDMSGRKGKVLYPYIDDEARVVCVTAATGQHNSTTTMRGVPTRKHPLAPGSLRRGLLAPGSLRRGQQHSPRHGLQLPPEGPHSPGRGLQLASVHGRLNGHQIPWLSHQLRGSQTQIPASCNIILTSP